jgi:cell division protein FtsB
MTTPPSPKPERSILVPLAFWLCLLSSAVLFAAVALAPRLVEWHELHLGTLARQQQLVELEQHVQHLEHVVQALESDPHFRAEVIRREIGGSEPGELIPVEKSLTVDVTLPAVEGPNVPFVVPWYIPILKTLSVPSDWRRRLLWVSAGLCLFAFVALREREPSASRR